MMVKSNLKGQTLKKREGILLRISYLERLIMKALPC